MKIKIPALQRELTAEAGANLLATLVQEKIPIAHSCAGDGVCGTCLIHIEGADVPAEGNQELRLKLKQCKEMPPANTRFACLTNVPESSKTWVLRTDYW